MNSFNKASIKKNIQDKNVALDNEVRQDLAKIFDNAMNTVDEYEEEDVTGGEIRRSASNWSEKINYALDELPQNHPLRKSGKIQKLVNKLESIVQKPDNEVTHDVMVAGGKPPSVSKQRFWDPIARMIADAQVDVIKPKVQTETDSYQEPKPTFAPQRQANVNKDKPKVSNIPDKPKMNLTRVPKNTEQPFTREVPAELRRPELESGAKPGYVTNQIRTSAIGASKFASQASKYYEEMINSIQEAQSEAVENKHNIQQTIAAIKLATKKTTVDNLKKDEIQAISALYLELFDYIKGIADHLDHAMNVYNDMPKSMLPPSDSPIDWNVELFTTYKFGESLSYQFQMFDGQDIKDSIETSGKEENFIAKIEMFLNEFYDGHVINKINSGLVDRQEHYRRLGQAYTDLIAIDKDKQVYNDFMKLLGDKRDSKSIRLAIEQYVNNMYGK
jgi:hypothetical protein